jgi:predicted amidophosphoribosyltransferase
LDKLHELEVLPINFRHRSIPRFIDHLKEDKIMKGYCPLCKKEVEYEYSYGDLICPICGRSKSSAKEDAQILERADRMRTATGWTHRSDHRDPPYA